MQETESVLAARPVAPDTRPKALRSVDEALGQLLAGIVPIADHDLVPTADARGRVVATPLRSQLDVPAADNSQMDGYAVRRADLVGATPANPVDLPVSQRIPAGHVGSPLAAGTVARIFTGAPMPDGADAVVMQESVEIDETSKRARFSGTPAPGEWVRRRGEDIRDRQVILDAGTRLGPQHLGLAASIGTAEIAVVRRPRVAIFSTGDELAMPGEVAVADLKPGSLYNSNRFTLRATIEALGCAVVDLGIVPDTLAATRAALVRAASGADVIVTSGGVSVGEEDHMRPAVSAEGSIDFWQIAIKPGKPLAFGRVRGALFVGLPGNPVSSFVTFLVFVRPLLMRLQGIADVAPRAYRLRADFDWPKPDRRQEFLRVRVNADGGLDLFAQQGSAVMTSTVWADGLLDNPPGRPIARGDVVRFIPFADLLK
jgi:molybdopterin molybdotransferase